MGKGGGSINVGSNSLGISFFQDNRVKEIESHFGATNFSYNPSKSWSLSGFVIATSTLVVVAKDTSFYMEEGDVLQINASANSSVHGVVSYEVIS